MAIAFRAASSKVTDNVTPFSQAVALPSGVAANDIVLLVGTTEADGTLSISAAGSITTWTTIVSNLAATGAATLFVAWGRYSSGSTGPTIDSTANHLCAGTIAYSGCATSGSPIENTATGSETTSDTSGSFATGQTSLLANEVSLLVATSTVDSNTAQHSNQANTALSAVAERIDFNTNAGDGSGFTVTEGFNATPDSIGTWTWDLANNSPKTYASILLFEPNDVSPGIIAQTPTISAPRVDQSLAPGIITQTGTISAPQVNLSAAPGIITQTPTIAAPQMNLAVTPELIVHDYTDEYHDSYAGPTVFALTVDLSLPPALISQTGVIHAPDIQQSAATLQVFPDLLNYAGTTSSPSIDQSLTPGLISSAGATFSPQVNLSALPGVTSQTGVIYEPQKVDNAGIFPPQIDLSAVGGFIDQTGVIYAPSNISSPGVDQEVEPDPITQTGAIAAPQVNLAGAPGLISQVGVIYEPVKVDNAGIFPPTVNLSAEGGLISQVGQVFSPTLQSDENVAPDLINQSGITFAPTLAITVLGTFIDQTGVIYAPLVVGGGAEEGGFGGAGIIPRPVPAEKLMRLALIESRGKVFDLMGLSIDRSPVLRKQEEQLLMLL